MQFVNIGFGNMVNAEKICSIVSPEAAPVKRMVQSAKDDGLAVDGTCGRKTKSVIVLDNNSVVLSSLLPDTIVSRL
ncbi:MAG: DUF370 domain-containing protein [Eubacterium sp.]|nr:DUF370 domain-containing protein [Eubacterium sp.]MBR0119585.1 DUF370 domain-containing protein [Eubacterium sp.]